MPETNVSDLLRSSAQRDALGVALIEGETQTSYGDLDADVDRVARGLKTLGVENGDRVALFAPNSTTFVVGYFAALRADAVAVPVNAHYTAVELRAVLESAEAKVLLVHGSLLELAREALAELADAPQVVVGAGEPADGEHALDALDSAEGDPPQPMRGGEDLAVLLFTSGTTTESRAAQLPHRALLANLDQVLALEPRPVGSADVLLGAIPFFHVYGLNFVLGVAMATGARVVVTSGFDPDGALALIREHRVSVLMVVPRLVGAWSDRDDLGPSLHSVRLVISGAAALPLVLIHEFQTRTGKTLHQGYGLTEASPVVTTTLSAPVAKAGSIGRPLPGVQVKLVDETGGEVDEDDAGELLIKGENLFLGYWPDGNGGPDSEGWWRTGDVCYADQDGDLFLVDRVKDLIIVNGFNVYPSEVEEVIRSHSGVAEVAVVPSAHPVTGEAVKAFVALEQGASVTTDELLEHSARSLARFKRPTIVEFVDALPTTSTGKVSKRRLREDKLRAGLV